MTTFQALAIGLGLVAVATLIATIRPAVSRRGVLITLILALFLSGGSVAVSSQRHSGMGTMTSRGYPKPYAFQWIAFEGPEKHAGFNALYFAANTCFYVGVIAVVAAVWPRRRISSPTMPVRMLMIRLALGVVLLILAVIGAVLPVMQGWLFFLLAILVLFPRTAFAEKVLRKAEPKLPRLVGWLRRLGIGTQVQ